MTAVLFVCSGNLCRSPTAAGLLRRTLNGQADVLVGSAGLIEEGYPSPPEMVAAAGESGVDLAGHLSRSVTAPELEGADLVVGMARLHIREVVVRSPAVWSRAFTLPELVRRGHEVGRRTPDRPIGDWLTTVHAGRQHADLLADAPGDEIADPMGGGPEDYRQMVERIDELVTRMVELIWTAPLLAEAGDAEAQ